jgi:hypothetical protein
MPNLIQAITTYAINHPSTLNDLNLVVTSVLILILVTLEVFRARGGQPFKGRIGVVSKTVIVLIASFAVIILAKTVILFTLANQLKAA